MIRKIFVVMTMLTLISAPFKVYAYEKGDFQIWNTDTEEVKLYKGVKLAMEQEFRFGENASEFFYQHYEFGVVFGFAKVLDLAFCYRLVLDRVKRKWMEEDMPNVNATLKHEIGKLKLEDRNRIEYRHYRYKDDSIRYRNKFTMKYPIGFKSIKISPFASNEIFVSSNSTGYNENRFSAGTEFELAKYVKADIYYMLKSNKVKDYKWTDANVLGTKIKISF
ncbi:MAG: DUF2490 domain-containing protein [Candidatus Omnitrophota bacterium]